MNEELEAEARSAAEEYLRRMYAARGERWEDEQEWVRNTQIGHLLVAVQAHYHTVQRWRSGESDVPAWVPGVLERLEDRK